MIKMMEVKGRDEEEEELKMGEREWKKLLYVKLKNIKWELIYGEVI